MRLSGVNRSLYDKFPNGTRSKRQRGALKDEELLQMIEENAQNKIDSRFSLEEITTIAKIIEKSKKDI